jgi:hypothetical protein
MDILLGFRTSLVTHPLFLSVTHLGSRCFSTFHSNPITIMGTVSWRNHTAFSALPLDVRMTAASSDPNMSHSQCRSQRDPSFAIAPRDAKYIIAWESRTVRPTTLATQTARRGYVG